VFLKDSNDISDKIWNEDALRKWEAERNNGTPWIGRMEHGHTISNTTIGTYTVEPS
jgi:hypothetical protein